MAINAVTNKPVTTVNRPPVRATTQEQTSEPTDKFVKTEAQSWSPTRPVLDKPVAQQETRVPFTVQKPSSNSSREIRNDVMKQLGFTQSDIAAYDAKYPTRPGCDKPDNNGFYVNNGSDKKWATPAQVKSWQTDANGNTTINVAESSVNHLKDFKLNQATQNIKDPDLRERVQSDLKNVLWGKTEQERVDAYRSLTSNDNLSDPTRRAEISSSLDSLGTGNPYVTVANAKFAARQNNEFIGPVTDDVTNKPANLLKQSSALANSGKLPPSEAALLNREIGYVYGDMKNPEMQRNSEMLARFQEMDVAEREKYKLSRTVPRLKEDNTTSMSAPTKEQQELDAFERNNNFNNPKWEKRELQEDPWKETYPGNRRLDNRNLRVNGAVGLIEEWNKWGSLPGKMRDATQRIQKWEDLKAKANSSNNYPVPPKPTELKQFREQMAPYVSKEQLDEMMPQVEQASRAYWKQ